MSFTYELNRSKRKTVSIAIKNGKVMVAAPLHLEQKAIHQFVVEKSDWIAKKLKTYNDKISRFESLLYYDYLMLEGKFYKIVFAEKSNVKSICIDIENGQIIIPKKYFLGDTQNVDNKKLINALKNWYKKIAFEKLKNILDFYSSKLNLPYQQFSSTNAKGKWGSCDSKNNIMLNWRLLMLDSLSIEYVAIHELCHTQYHNHSKNYWFFVEKFCKDYKKRRAVLKNYSIINELFR